MKSVFLSSVARGLEPYREAVFRAINGLDGYHCVRMEDFGARTTDPAGFCESRVAECDIFIGLVGHGYGSSPRDSDKSYTEAEYDAAVACKKPCLMFQTPEEFPVPANLIENDETRQKQEMFRRRIRQKETLEFFENDKELAAKVVQAIHNERENGLDVLRVQQGPSTRLLFPFVTNRFGYDTGIAVINTTADPFGTEPSSGTCGVSYYGDDFGGTLPVPAKQTSSVVGAGEQLVFTLSGGNAGNGILAAPGFQGYLIVECHFTRAAGFAHMKLLGKIASGTGYLAQVL